MSQHDNFIDKQDDKFRYQNYLKSILYLTLLHFPLDQEISQATLKQLHAQLRERGYKQELINTWFKDVNHNYSNSDGMLAIKVENEPVYIFIEELPEFKEKLWKNYNYEKIDLDTFQDFIIYKFLIEEFRDKNDTEIKQIEETMRLIPEVNIIEEYLYHQLYALGYDREYLDTIKEKTKNEAETLSHE